MNWKIFFVCAAVVLLVLGAVAGTAAALPHQDNGGSSTGSEESGEDEEDDDDDSPVININLDRVVSAINDLIGSVDDLKKALPKIIKQGIYLILYDPIADLLRHLVVEVFAVISWVPQVHPNPVVQKMHKQMLLLSYVLSGIGVMIVGIVFMVGFISDRAYAQAKKAVPRLFVALIFATVSLPLLQYAVDFTNLLTQALRPEYATGPAGNLAQMAGVENQLLIVVLVNFWAFLAVFIMFIARNVLIMIIAAASPLIAVGWALPFTRKYSQKFIAAFWTALAMGPADMLVLKFSYALMTGAGNTPLQSVSNWLYGLAAAVLMIWIPWQLGGAAQAAVIQGYAVTSGIRSSAKQAGSMAVSAATGGKTGAASSASSLSRRGSGYRRGRRPRPGRRVPKARHRADGGRYGTGNVLYRSDSDEDSHGTGGGGR